MALLESIMDEARGYSSRVDMSTSLYEDACATFELQEQLNEASLTYEMAVYLSEGKDDKKSNTLWQKAKEAFKRWWAKAKAFMTKIYLYVKSLVVKLFNKVKNMVVDTFEATVTDIADYKRFQGNIKQLLKVSDVKSVKDKEVLERIRDLKEAWSETRANRKAIKINKSQFSQYKALAETVGVLSADASKNAENLQNALDDEGKRTEAEAKEELGVNVSRSALTSLTGLIASIGNALASDIKVLAGKGGKGKFEDKLDKDN